MASNTEWFVTKGDKTYGPFTSAQLKELAAAGKIKPDTSIRLGTDGKWTPAEKVKGLFSAPSPQLPPAIKPPVVRPTTLATGLVVPVVPAVRASDIVQAGQTLPATAKISTIQSAIAIPATPAPPALNRLCPFCGESIAPVAIKCKHCGEFLDGRPKEIPQTAIHAAPTAAPVNVVVNQIVGAHGPRWSRGVAVILSLIIPGLGQMYKGQIINGLAWFVVTMIGYAALIVPGLVLHLCCIIGAASGDPYR